MRKLTRTMLRSITLKILKEQDYICPVCKLKIDPTVKGEAVCDHDHSTGQVRGVLHRSCNSALGKMDNAVGRWGAKSMEYTALIAWFTNALAYYNMPGHPYIYPTFQTEDEKRIARNAKERRQRAERKARQVVRTRNATDKSSD